MYGMMPPITLPPTFSGGATFSTCTANGLTNVGARPRPASRAVTIRSR